MLSIRSQITQDLIWNAIALAPGHPVFKIEGYGDDTGVVDALVIKQEAGAHGRNVDFAAGMMDLVDPSARTEVLSQMEVNELRAWSSYGGVGDARALPGAAALRNQLAHPGAWVKMEVKRLTMLDSAIDSRLAGDKSDVRVIARALKNPGGLEKLAEIITVDLFNGNNDRIVFPPPGQKYPGFSERFKTIWNVGNVFIACDGDGVGRPIGLDSFDPNNEFRDLHTAIDVNQWPGRLLTPAFNGARMQFAADVVFDLELALGPRNRKTIFGSKKRLGSNRKQRVLNGMASGEQKLRNALVNWRQGGGNLPAGVTSRMTALNW